LSALFTALLLWLAGQGLIALAAGPGRRPRGPLELHATALLLGATALPLLGFYAVWILGPLPPGAGLALLLGAATPGALCAVRHHRAALAARGQPRPWTPLQRLGAAVLVSFALFAVFAAASVPMHGFDATFHYAYKARLLFHEGFGTPAWTELEGPVGRTMTHPTYPPLLPALELLVAWVRGGYDDDAARPLMALFALVPAALLVAELGRRGRSAGLLAGLAWITLPVLYYWRLPHPDPLLGTLGLFLGPEAAAARFGTPSAWMRAPAWCLDGTADLPLAALVLAAFLHATRLLSGRGDRLDVLGAGVLGAGALLAKNEGLALVALLGLALALGCWRARARRGALALLVAVGVAALTSAGWFVARAGLPTVDEDYPSRITPAVLRASLGRAGEVAGRFARSLLDVSAWNLTWPLFLAAVAWALARRRVALASPVGVALLVIAGGSAIYALVLMVTPWNLELLATTGIPLRLLLHLAPLAVFATFALLFPRSDP